MRRALLTAAVLAPGSAVPGAWASNQDVVPGARAVPVDQLSRLKRAFSEFLEK